MLAVAKKQPADVEPITERWRLDVRERLRLAGRGSHARLAREAKLRSGELADMLADDESPGQARHHRSGGVTRVNAAIVRLWPDLLPLSPDTIEVQHVLNGLSPEMRAALRAIRDMPATTQAHWAAVIAATSKKP